MTKPVSAARKLWVNLTNWEFWPFSVLYFPVYFYYVWLVIRHRSFFFFTAANPSIDFGGMLGERKSEIFELIPKDYIPKYKLIPPGQMELATNFAMKTGYPLIAKPDVGERGNLVEKIHDEACLAAYVKKCPVSFLLQEFVDYPVELGLFYVRFPGEKKGKVSSIVQKDFLHVTGDGKRTVRTLLQSNTRAALQLDFDHPRFEELMGYTPAAGEQVVVEPIGNHCRGTTFLDQTGQADERLAAAFDRLAGQIEGFYFGRFDLRCRSFEELRDLQNFKILELNGAGAEPGHIYQPGYSLWKAYQSIFWHLNVLAQISRANKKRGHAYWSFGKGLKKLKMIRAHDRLIKNSQ